MRVCARQRAVQTTKISLIHNIQYSWIKKITHNTLFDLLPTHKVNIFTLHSDSIPILCKMLIVVVVIGCVVVFFFEKTNTVSLFPCALIVEMVLLFQIQIAVVYCGQITQYTTFFALAHKISVVLFY